MHSVGNGNRTVVYDGKIAGLYDLEETLGSGHFAVVKLARHVFTGEKVAVKVIDKTKLDEVSRAHLFQEVRCMKLVQHPNVVRLYEVIDTQTKLYLILELGDGGDLYDYIMKHEGGLSENLAREYFRQIVRAISYCHQLHVVHRDLKPENVVFFEKLGVVKLTDFGFSNKFCPGQKLETSCGSLAYSAPEILLGDSYDAPAVDIWSLGVILYMLVCGQPPFEKANDSETLTMIMDCKYTMPSHVSSGCRHLIAMMLVREPEKRANLSQIASDPWLVQGAQQQEIVPEYLPLVSRQQVSDDDHTLIINKMVSGNIATKEEILDALDRNEYNHITATYFLLAERKLRQQRQEQIQKRRPELSLPVSSSSRLSPRTRAQQGVNRDSKAQAGEPSNQLLVPTCNQLCIPRTPGAETTTGGRSRKCSIVQEEDDEDEISGCTNRDELTTPLNRRGSRSEGRINLAIQDRVECERLKKEKNPIETKTSTTATVTSESPPHQPPAEATSTTTESGTESFDVKRKYSIDQMKSMQTSGDCDVIQTKVLIDSSTIQIPITTTMPSAIQDSNMIPKYKTMPSPTRPNILLSGPGTRALNEIFEEGTDVGSSDTSATTTPRPITRNTHFTSRGATPQRKSKFHKTRTPSCSSSDASDDDSESRKKRAHKIADVSKPLQSQRRDSHDDSSDSQDQGNAPSSSGGGNSSSYLVCSTNNMGASTKSSNQDSSGQQTTTTQNDSSTSNTQNSISSSSSSNGGGNCDKTDQKHQQQQQQQQQPTTHYRRHRAGRRRAGETRLRESQSLNRITEVQETIELPPSLNQPLNVTNYTEHQKHDHNNHNHHNNNNNNNNTNNINMNNINNNYSKNCHNGSITSSLTATTTATAVSPVTTPTVITKPKGLSARLFQGFIRKNDFVQTAVTMPLSSPVLSSDGVTTTKNTSQHRQQQLTSDGSDSSKVVTDNVDFAKAIRVTATCGSGGGGDVAHTTTTKGSSATKKLKMLGRYFQVHKKICIPLPGLFQKGRLYKAQSCGSLVRDKVNTTTTSATSVMTTSTTVVSTTVNSHLPPTPSTNTRHSAVLFTEKGNILRNCLVGAKLLGNSDGDINQNQNHHHPMMMKSTTTTTASATTTMMMMKNSSSSSLNHSKRNSISESGYGNCDGAAAVVAAASLLKQFCSSQPLSLSTTTPITTTTVTPLSVSATQLSAVENYCKNDDDDDENMSTSLHQLNDVSLCSSKC